MDVLKAFLFVLLSSLLSSCQVGYYWQSAKGQLALWNDRVPFDEALNNSSLSEGEKSKIRLTQEVKAFAEKDLQLAHSKNYTTYVHLNRSAVTYVVSAAEKWKLEHFLWKFPIVGEVPYRGYFNEQDAKEEGDELSKQGLDVFVRGVSAYSTLGYFQDSLLSSMTSYSDHELVNTIIHETVHTTIYIKGHADFNEKLATFVAGIGTLQFYAAKEGADSATAKRIAQENHDENLFSRFIQGELADLKIWYTSQSPQDEAARQQRLRDIQDRFVHDILPQMQTENYQRFSKLQLNNARLLVYKTYLDDFSAMQRLFDKCGGTVPAFMEKIMTLKGSDNPEKDLEKLAQ